MIVRHISKCLIAGIVAILPIAGTVVVIAYMESAISSSGIAKLPFYFPGLGLLLTAFAVYLLGLVATTVIGRWVWGRFDRLMNRLPAIGKLYGSLKQILGYGEGAEAIFQEVVTVRSSFGDGEEIGLVTNRIRNPGGPDKLAVFVPSAPNPTTGRMLILSSEQVAPSALSVHDALKSLVTVAKNDPRFPSSNSTGGTPGSGEPY